MKFEYLKEFVELSKTLNYSQCASCLYITQPTLTRHIQEIENELDVALFARHSKGISLTKAGELFLPYATKAVELEREYTDVLDNFKREKRGVISIGSIHAIQQYGISKFFQEWGRSDNGYKTTITELDTSELIYNMRTGKMDFAFIREDYPEENADMDRIIIGDDYLVCLVPKDHPLSKRESVTISELKNEKIVYYEDCFLMRNLFWAAGFNPKDGLSGAKGRNALLQVKQGMGLMLYFRKPIDDSELGDFSILKVEPEIHSNISLVYHEKELTSTGKAFLATVKKCLEESSKDVN